jgi:hypothetical protein
LSQGDTAKDLVSQFQGDPQFVLPLNGQPGYLRIAATGETRTIELDGEKIAEMRRATITEPWREFAFEREGHSFVVAFRFVFRGTQRPDASSIIEVFADDINLHDGRSLGQWRDEAPKPGEFPFLGRNGLPRVAGFRVLWRGWAVVAVLLCAWQIVRGQSTLVPRSVALVGFFALWFEIIHLAQEWAMRRTDLGPVVRLGVVLATFPVGVLVLFVIVLVVQGSR